MTLTVNQKEYIQLIISNAVEIFKVFMACLLSVFVPQHCPETGTTCTLEDNFNNLSMFNEFVVAFNFITLFIFLNLYRVQNKRETYMISHLDINPEIPDNALEESLKNNQKILGRISGLNQTLYNWTVGCVACHILNTVFSTVLIFYYYYDGFKSVTTLLTNFLLVCSKLYLCYDVSDRSLRPKTKALSCNKSEYASYNDIDKKYIQKVELTTQ
jgi:hypothetical protein